MAVYFLSVFMSCHSHAIVILHVYTDGRCVFGTVASEE